MQLVPIQAYSSVNKEIKSQPSSVEKCLATKPTQQMRISITPLLFTHWSSYFINPSKVCSMHSVRPQGYGASTAGLNWLDTHRQFPSPQKVACHLLSIFSHILGRHLPSYVSSRNQAPDSASQAQPSFPLPIWMALRVHPHTHYPSTSPCRVAKIVFQLDWI